MNRFDISVIGLSCVDCIATSLTRAWNVQNLCSDLRIAGGGLGNALVALAGLELKVGVATRIGSDLFGDFLLERWRELGVDTSGVVRDPARSTGLSFIASHEGERTPFFSPGANAAFGLEDIPSQLIESSRCMLIFFAGALPALDGEPMLELVRRCRESGTAVILDVIDSAAADYAPIPSYAPYVNLVVNSEEGSRLTGEQSPALMLPALEAMSGGDSESPLFVAVTERGAVTLSAYRDGERRRWRIASPFYGRPVHNVVGAGDAFRAGLAAFICRHDGDYWDQSMDYEKACLYASAVSYLYLSRNLDVRPFCQADIERLLETVQFSGNLVPRKP